MLLLLLPSQTKKNRGNRAPTTLAELQNLLNTIEDDDEVFLNPGDRNLGLNPKRSTAIDPGKKCQHWFRPVEPGVIQPPKIGHNRYWKKRRRDRTHRANGYKQHPFVPSAFWKRRKKKKRKYNGSRGGRHGGRRKKRRRYVDRMKGEHHGSVTSKEWNHWSGSAERSRKLKKWMPNELRDLKNATPPGAKASYNYADYRDHLIYYLTNIVTPELNHSMLRKVRRLDFHAYMRRKAAIRDISERMSGGFGKYGVVFLGNWKVKEGAKGGRNCRAFPWDEVLVQLRRVTNVVIIDEAWTSKRCSKCSPIDDTVYTDAQFADLPVMEHQMGANNRPLWSVLTCSHCVSTNFSQRPLQWDRDVNATRNIHALGMHLFSHGFRRPTIFGKSSQHFVPPPVPAVLIEV